MPHQWHKSHQTHVQVWIYGLRTNTQTVFALQSSEFAVVTLDACASAHFNWPDTSSVSIWNVWYGTVFSDPAVCDRSPWIAAPGYKEHWPRSEWTFAPFHRRMETSVCRQKAMAISASFSDEQKDARVRGATFSAVYRWNHVLRLLV